jgi:hypothetical protein
VPRFVVPAVLALAAVLSAQTDILPLKDVRAGMRGVGRTVFTGDRIEEFQVEILGVLDNYGPKESIILGRLSGGSLEQTGVMQGMSGSPVYINGKLAGAVAMAFPFAKEPIAGIRPIEDMLRTPAPVERSRRAAAGLADKDLFGRFPRPVQAAAAGTPLVDIATPISFGGFSRATLDAFAPELRAVGLEPRQAATSGGNIPPGMGNPANLKPGSMISVQLMAGDYSVAADGTVTHVDGNRVYAFGHRFLDVGATALPFARSEVLTVVPTLNTSFKLSTAREWMGTISHDQNLAISGELGKQASLVPVTISVTRDSRPVQSYRMQMVDDPLLSPLLIQMAVFSALDVTERTVGAATVRLAGEVEFQGAPAPVVLNNLYALETGSAEQVSLNAAIPVAYVMQNGHHNLRLRNVALRLETFEKKKQLTIDSLSASRRVVRPGENVDLNILMVGDRGVETMRKLSYTVPTGLTPGALYFTVADANTTNLTDFRQVLTSLPHTPAQLVGVVNNLHPNSKAFVRVWRANPAFQLEGADLPDPPASVAMILGSSQSNMAGISQTRNSKLAQLELDGGDMVISGTKTIQVEVKE